MISVMGRETMQWRGIGWMYRESTWGQEAERAMPREVERIDFELIKKENEEKVESLEGEVKRKMLGGNGVGASSESDGVSVVSVGAQVFDGNNVDREGN